MILKSSSSSLHAVASMIMVGILMSGCSGPGVTNDSHLSPAEQQLRQSNARFTQTVGEGAVVGAAIGGIAGLAFGGSHRGQAAVIGAAAGGALGTGAGYLVASNNLRRSSTEAEFTDAIQKAAAEAATFRAAASSSHDIAEQASIAAAQLAAQYRAHQITQEQYQAGLAQYKEDDDAIKTQIYQAQKAAAAMRASSQVASGAEKIQFTKTAADTEESARQLTRYETKLSRELASS